MARLKLKMVAMKVVAVYTAILSLLASAQVELSPNSDSTLKQLALQTVYKVNSATVQGAADC